MIAIHDSTTGFHPRWVAYCQQNDIPYRLVNCYDSDIIQQLEGCSALMWHHGQSNPRDILIARQILSALEHAGLKVFPDFRTAWHFDDKVAQKYLFEALDIPAVPAHVFVERDKALAWVENTEFPKVFKLRRGAGSAGVQLMRNRQQARRLIKRAFGRGFPVYDPWGSLKERLYKARSGQASLVSLLKGAARIVYPPRYSKILGRERGYVYFQDFMPNNNSDTRVMVVGDKACALRRNTRPGDFRASGSGLLDYNPEIVNKRCIEIGFEVSEKLKADALAFDFVFGESGEPYVIEISYGSPTYFYDGCPGYWNRDIKWCGGDIDVQGWMIEQLVKKKI